MVMKGQVKKVRKRQNKKTWMLDCEKAFVGSDIICHFLFGVFCSTRAKAIKKTFYESSVQLFMDGESITINCTFAIDASN
ncbi:MAG: hypothetical protein BBJ60_04290 [Desulfobacterales bacterium S7086C20]|nr:MAG: hypothetical protein BBJ60_04290 [Desulfobacterales bacterium S7086C20]